MSALFTINSFQSTSIESNKRSHVNVINEGNPERAPAAGEWHLYA